jgi:hypothetical protein
MKKLMRSKGSSLTGARLVEAGLRNSILTAADKKRIIRRYKTLRSEAGDRPCNGHCYTVGSPMPGSC